MDEEERQRRLREAGRLLLEASKLAMQAALEIVVARGLAEADDTAILGKELREMGEEWNSKG